MTMLDDFRDQVLAIIERRGMSKADLARRAGVNREYLGRWLNGYRRNVSVEYVEKVLAAARSSQAGEVCTVCGGDSHKKQWCGKCGGRGRVTRG